MLVMAFDLLNDVGSGGGAVNDVVDPVWSPSRLRQVRVDHGLTQAELAGRLGIARSTLANLESGREPVSDRLGDRLGEEFPEVAGVGGDPAGMVLTEQAADLPGPFVIESVNYVYVFEQHLSPSEIVEFRRVRATRAGASGYTLYVAGPQEGFRVEEEALFGGSVRQIRQYDAQGRGQVVARFDFGLELARGQVHEFAVRSWVEHAPGADAHINTSFSMPVTRAGIHLVFNGPRRPDQMWCYGPQPYSDDPPPTGVATAIPVGVGGAVSAVFEHPDLGPSYGVFWQWPDTPSISTAPTLGGTR